MKQANVEINVILLLVLLFTQSGISIAEDQAVSDSGIRKYGVVHNIAEDRKVEKVGGIYEPEGLDKYLQRRLDEVNGRLDQISDKLNQIDEKLESLSAELQTASGSENS